MCLIVNANIVFVKALVVLREIRAVTVQLTN